MPFLSVIIPVYNVDRYLCQCVDSVLNQKLEDYELILVDDGSTDTSPQICDEYAARFHQVQVIHQKNGGASMARNSGIHVALGDYVVFVDSDDWWNSDVSVKRMLAEVRRRPDIDMFLFGGVDYIEGEGFYERNDSVFKFRNTVYSAMNYYKTMLAEGNLQVSPATKFIKTSFLCDNGLFFRCGITGEDNEWMIRILRCDLHVMILQDPLYICRIGRQGSVTNTIKRKNISDLLQIINASLTHYSPSDVDRIVMDYEYCFCAYLWFCALGLSRNLSREERISLKPQFTNTAMVCRYSNSRKTKMAYSVYRFCGYDVAVFVLGSYIRLKRKLRFNKRKVL